MGAAVEAEAPEPDAARNGKRPDRIPTQDPTQDPDRISPRRSGSPAEEASTRALPCQRILPRSLEPRKRPGVNA